MAKSGNLREVDPSKIESFKELIKGHEKLLAAIGEL